LGDAAAALRLFRPVPYGKEFDVVPNVRARYSDAGHILGSATVRLSLSGNGVTKTLGFTGDVGRWNMPIIKDPAFMGNVEALISESTYGGKLHAPPEDMEKDLAADLARAIQRGGKVIVPAFSIGRTQDLVYSLHKMFDAGKLPHIPIFVDSPLAVNATEIYRNHPECFDEETSAHLTQSHDPFGLNQLHYVRSVEESKRLNVMKEPCMIIAASGMCEAGRILHHLANNVENPVTMILIVGYQAEHTLGYKLVHRDEEVRILGTMYKLKAEVVVHNSFSAHADNDELVKYIAQFDRNQLQHIYLVHGEYERQLDLQAGLKKNNFPNIEIPSRSQTFEL
jgi:metallo-beta-lactamase family protein